MTYIKWNDLIAENFFNEDMAGKEVLLFVDEALINEIGSKIGKNTDNFISSVIEGPPWVNVRSNSGICRKAIQTYKNWRLKKKIKYPPYIGYLALFVLAGYVEDENYSPNAYYPKLRSLLREDEGGGQYPFFNQMINLWMDLEKWSKEDKFEELGRFNVRVRGNLRHVGLPQSQTIISSKERKSLPLIFNRAGIIFSDSPDYETIRNILLEHGQDILAKKTLRLLNLQEKDKHLLQALLNLVIDELNEWDGSLPEEFLDTNTFARARLKICINLNKVTEKATFSLRINAQNEFPDETLFLQRKGNIGLFQCTRSIENWSSELKSEDGSILNGTSLDWLNGENFEDQSNRWKCTLKGTSVRVFAEGRKFGLPNNLVEISRLERGSRFILLCNKTYVSNILEWGKNSCESFSEINYQGVPAGWSLFSGINPSKSCMGISELTIGSEIKIRHVDGIRLGKGNTYLKAAPPKLLIENSNGTEIPFLNDKPLKFNTENRYWELPEDLPIDQTLTINILNEGIEIRRTNFKITNSRIYNRDKKRYFDTAGLQENEDNPLVIGVNVYNNDSIQFEKEYALPTYSYNEIIFLGQHPGEIFHWQSKAEINLEWEPVWAICRVKRRKWKAEFCSMKKIEDCQINNQIYDKNDFRFWKTVMRKMRKSIKSPEFPPLKELWESYLEVAKNVH
ncbi:hypothetical protein V7138_01300 [Bacillus sp. JJ1533]|uniref:hypothetical protein n=1 Tax=Bacillus sp. JJ1533 TaxID=3122959 RepID=UPI0030000575